jgi:hypothetical protein
MSSERMKNDYLVRNTNMRYSRFYAIPISSERHVNIPAMLLLMMSVYKYCRNETLNVDKKTNLIIVKVTFNLDLTENYGIQFRSF